MAENLDRLRLRFEQLLEGVARERLEMELSPSRPSGVGALYLRSADLFTLDRLSEVQLALAGAGGEEAKRIRFLLEGLAEGRARCAAGGELDRYLTWCSHAHFSAGESRAGVASASEAIAEVDDLERRRAAEDEILHSLDEQTPLLEGIDSARRRAVEELGYGPYVDSIGVLSGVDLPGLAAEAEQFLAETDGEYRELLAWHLPRLAGVEPDRARYGDALRLTRAGMYDEIFPAGDLAGRIVRLLRRSGIDPRAGNRLALREAPIGSLVAGASAHPVRIPDEVIVVLRPAAGRPVYAALLHSFGRALHAAHTAAEHPMEYRRLGDAAVPLAFGLLLEGLLANPVLVSRELGLPASRTREYLRLCALLDLLRNRASAARLLYGLEWFREPALAGRDPRFTELLRHATGVHWDSRAALWDLVAPFQAVRELRAEQLRSLLFSHFRERFDEDWYRNPRSGPDLRALLSHGRAFTADELSIQIGSSGLSFDRVRSRIAELAG